jgi:hypothetical protein
VRAAHALALSLIGCRFEETVTVLSQEPTNTEEMDALEKYLQRAQQVGLAGVHM